jgi:hypothetical protein
MSSLIRVFCREDPAPTLQQLVDILNDEGFDAHVDKEDDGDEVDLENQGWRDAMIVFSEEQDPLHIECWRADQGDELTELREELLEELEEVEGSGKNRVVRHIKGCAFVVNIALISEAGEEGIAAQHAIAGYLAETHEGLTYVEGEGFYSGEDVILELT